MATTKTRTRTPVATRRVVPVRPERSSFPAGVDGTRKFREAENAYESALWAYAAESGAPDFDGDLAALEAHFAADAPAVGDYAKLEKAGIVQKPARRTRSAKNAETVKAAEKKAPAKRRPPVEREHQAVTNGQVERTEQAAHDAKKRSTARASAKKAAEVRKSQRTEPPVPAGFKSWKDPKLAARILKLKDDGKTKRTIKQVASELGYPADAGEKIWHKVSLVYRAAADARGIERPRLSPEALAARQARASA